MRTMTWEEIDKDWAVLQRQHRMEIGQAVARYCIGHSISDVAKHLGYSRSWVVMQLDFAGASVVLASQHPLTGGDGENVQKELPKLIRKFRPDVTVSANGDEVEIDGDDADEYQPVIDKYLEQGHSVAAAERLANSEVAVERAVEDGVIKETKDKHNRKVNQILFPDAEKDSFELNLRRHMANVISAARFLDEAKMNRLRLKSTGVRVSEANAKWAEQFDRISNLHETLI